jgi:hypothetical protein
MTTIQQQQPSSRLISEDWREVPQPTRTTTISSDIHPILNTILASNQPMSMQETGQEKVTVGGETGFLGNRQDIINWSGTLPLDQYPINEDPNPEVIRKRTDQTIAFNQEIAIRYLRPSTPPPPGDILISHEAPLVPPPAPPIVLNSIF